MKVFVLRSSLYVAAAAALALTGGCSGANVAPVGQSSNVLPSSAVSHGNVAVTNSFPRHPYSLHTSTLSLQFGSAGPAAISQSLYAAQFQATVVNEYALPNNLNNPPACTVPGTQVNGLGVNNKRKLYVPNADGNIRTYLPGCGAAGPVLVDTNGQPADVAFDGKTVYIANASNGQIDVFANGSLSPTGTLSNPASAAYSFGVAVDHSHNVYQSADSPNGVIIEYALGAGSGTVLPITGISFPIGVLFDKSNNLIVIDANSGGALIYAPPYSGAPTRTIPCVAGGCFWAKLDRANARLYFGSNGASSVEVHKYPSGKLMYSFNNGFTNSVDGVAVDPEAP